VCVFFIRYPSIESVLADKSKYGIVTSQMHRFSRRCSHKSEFVYNTALVLHRMLEKGYRSSKIWHQVCVFLKSAPAPLWRQAARILGRKAQAEGSAAQGRRNCAWAFWANPSISSVCLSLVYSPHTRAYAVSCASLPERCLMDQ
jgi:hypothetical protein